jgi:dsRNA-specific ribonuclease
MSTLSEIKGIFLGERGSKFKTLIESLLKQRLKKRKYNGGSIDIIDILTDDQSMEMYGSCFTSDTVDEENNYQVFEQLGDITANKFIVWYFHRRFPVLFCAGGVKIVARLRINYGAKQSFCEIAKNLGFWDFISATNDLRRRNMKPMLEDVFEAFIGCTEYIIDQRVGRGVGHVIVYQILQSIFDEKYISLKFDDLFDPKTRLKELFDYNKNDEKYGPLVYIETKSDMITYSTVYRVEGGKYHKFQDGSVNKKKIIGGTHITIGKGSAALKIDAQQHASLEALCNLRRQNIFKNIPVIYEQFEDGFVPKKVITPEYIKENWGYNINSMQESKEKSKYQSTVLSLYCRKRNLSGVKSALQLNADMSIRDVDGMTPLDLLFIGKVDENTVKNIFSIIVEYGQKLEMNTAVYTNYYERYKNKFFKDQVHKFTFIH